MDQWQSAARVSGGPDSCLMQELLGALLKKEALNPSAWSAVSSAVMEEQE